MAVGFSSSKQKSEMGLVIDWHGTNHEYYLNYARKKLCLKSSSSNDPWTLVGVSLFAAFQ